MARRIRPTGCTKFLVVMIILVPLAFIIASLYNGKNPVNAFQELLGGEITVVEDGLKGEAKEEEAEKEVAIEEDVISAPEEANKTETAQAENKSKQKAIGQLEDKIDDLEKRLQKLEKQLQNQEEEY